MQFNEMLNIIDRIESIDEDTTADFIDDILGDVYYLLARECKDFIDNYKDHLEEIVVRFGDSETLPKQRKQTNSNQLSKKSKQVKPAREEEPIEDNVDYYDENEINDNYNEPLQSNDKIVITKKVIVGDIPNKHNNTMSSVSASPELYERKSNKSVRKSSTKQSNKHYKSEIKQQLPSSNVSYMNRLDQLINDE